MSSFKKQICAIFSALLVSTSATAGMLIEEKVTCPVGGQKFKIDGTASCSTMGRTLSLKPITSCDFITRLPVCPKNKLTMYRDFNDAEIKNIETFMQTKAYKTALTEPAYVRAYHLAKIIEDEKSLEPFLLLQSAVWYNQSNSQISNLYEKELQQARLNMDKEDLPFWLAAGSFEAWSHQDIERAKQRLQDAKTHADPENEYLGRYIKRLDGCYKGDLSDDECSSNTAIPRK